MAKWELCLSDSCAKISLLKCILKYGYNGVAFPLQDFSVSARVNGVSTTSPMRHCFDAITDVAIGVAKEQEMDIFEITT